MSVAVNYHLPSDRPEALDPVALERACDFALALIRQLDREVGRRVERESAAGAVV